MNKDCNRISSINTNPVKAPRHGSMVSKPFDFHMIVYIVVFSNLSLVEIMKKSWKTDKLLVIVGVLRL